jgi:hypothetical protein
MSAATGCSNEKVIEKSCSANYCAEVAFDEGGGAMTSTYTSVYLMKRDGRQRHRVLAGDNMDGVGLARRPDIAN